MSLKDLGPGGEFLRYCFRLGYVVLFSNWAQVQMSHVQMSHVEAVTAVESGLRVPGVGLRIRGKGLQSRPEYSIYESVS